MSTPTTFPAEHRTKILFCLLHQNKLKRLRKLSHAEAARYPFRSYQSDEQSLATARNRGFVTIQLKSSCPMTSLVSAYIPSHKYSHRTGDSTSCTLTNYFANSRFSSLWLAVLSIWILECTQSDVKHTKAPDVPSSRDLLNFTPVTEYFAGIWWVKFKTFRG